MKVYLIGASGSGKSVIGKRVAAELEWRHIDTDAEILVREGKATIADIFRERGEHYFRNCEREVINDIINMDGHIVVSTGGGLPAIEGLLQLMREDGLLIFLRASADTLWRRLQVGDELIIRPLLFQQGKSALERLCELRREYYEAAPVRIDTDGLNVAAASELVKMAITNGIYHSDKQ